MPASPRRRRVLMIAGTVAAVLAHLLLATWAVLAASCHRLLHGIRRLADATILVSPLPGEGGDR